ncbi:MAG: gliding motility-associated C-terminal domain-containing protein [Bacteroidia bacterium]
MKKLLLLFVLAGYALNASSQNNWEWARGASASDTEDQEGFAVTTDIFGNVYMTGFFSNTTMGFGSFSLSNAYPGQGDVYIAKYDLNGNFLWARSAGGPAEEIGEGLGTDAAGNVYLTGYFHSPSITFGSYTLSNAGSDNIYLVKYDPSGNVVWAKSAGGTSSDNATGLAVAETSVGTRIYIAGLLQSASSQFGGISVIPLGGGSAFIAQYDDLGNPLWVRTGGAATGTAMALGVTADSLGRATITGFFSASPSVFDSYSLNTSGGRDIFVASYDISGNIRWAKSAGGINADLGNSAATDACGNIYVTGYVSTPSATFDTLTVTSHSNAEDIFIAKYDTAGAFQWVRTAGKLGFNNSYSVATDISGNAYIGGVYADSMIFETDTLFYPPGGIDPVFIAKYDSHGTLLYLTSLASGGDDIFGIATDKSCNVYLSSDYIPSSFTIGDDTLHRTGGECSFVAKMSSSCFSKPSCRPCETALTFPNVFSPNSDGINDNFIPLEHTGASNTLLKIYNRWGEELFRSDDLSKGWNGTHNNKNCPDGTYFWILEYQDCNHESGRSRGFLSLVR